MKRIREFVAIWRQYRRFHSDAYALRTAWRITVQGIPF